MIDKLSLSFPMISDADRTGLISPLGVADPDNPREISRPALILFAPGGDEVWRFVSRDYADRLPEDDVLDVASAQGWTSAEQDEPELGPATSGPGAMPLDGLPFYLRGARFAALAMGLRHGHHDPSIKEDSKAYVAEMDRYLEAVRELLHPED